MASVAQRVIHEKSRCADAGPKAEDVAPEIRGRAARIPRAVLLFQREGYVLAPLARSTQLEAGSNQRSPIASVLVGGQRESSLAVAAAVASTLRRFANARDGVLQPPRGVHVRYSSRPHVSWVDARTPRAGIPPESVTLVVASPVPHSTPTTRRSKVHFSSTAPQNFDMLIKRLLTTKLRQLPLKLRLVGKVRVE
jgi:hypothetical protein